MQRSSVTESRHDAKVIDEDVKSSSLWVPSVPEDAAQVAGGALPDARQITPADRHVGGELAGGYAWAPDSAGFVALLSPGPKSDYLWKPELVTLDMAGAVHSLGHFEGLLKRPMFSPDGATIALRAAEGTMPASSHCR